MELLNKKNKKFVRIIIGSSESGDKGIKKPIKTICIGDTDVLEVYNILIKFFEKQK